MLQVELATGVYFCSPTAFENAGATFEERREWAIDHPVGTGPFKLKEVVRGAHVKYEKFADYWRGEPYLDGVDFLIVPDPTVSATMLEAGDADGYVYADHKAAVDMSKKEGFYARFLNKHSPQGIWPMATDPESVWYDKRVREALEYAINREAIVKAVDLGSGMINVMYQAPITPADPAWREGWGRKYDPDKARTLLQVAGLGEGFKTVIHNNSATPILGDVANMIQAMLADVGIEAEVNTISPGQYMGFLLRGWPVNELLISGIPNEPISEFVANRDYACTPPQIPKWNHSTATTPEMCEYWEEMRAADSPEAATAAYVKLSHQAMDDSIGAFIMDWPDTAVFADYVHTDWITYSTKVWNAEKAWMAPH
jgi:ABC-type transport system substrate-binding protein